MPKESLLILCLKGKWLRASAMFRVILIFLVCSFSLSAAEGVWTSLGPEGGAITQLWVHPGNSNRVFALTTSGLFTSSDGGSHWSTVTNGLIRGVPPLSFAADPANPDHLLVGFYQGGFGSIDGGVTWNQTWKALVVSGLPAYFSSIAISPTDPNLIFASNYYQSPGFFKSLDGGTTWVANTDTSITNANTLLVDSSDSNTVFLGTRGGIFKSKDAGEHWTRSDSSSAAGSVYALLSDPSSPTTLYAGAEKGVFKSTDKGLTWSPAKQGLGDSLIRALAIDPNHSNALYAGGSAGLFKTTDGGKSWNAISVGGADVSALAIAKSSPNTIFLGDIVARGVFKSSDGGNVWNPVNSGLYATDVQAFIQNPFTPQVFLALIQGRILFRSLDGGSHWELWGGAGLPNWRAALKFRWDPVNRDTLYLFGGIGIYKSADGGQTWTNIWKQGVAGFVIDPRDPSILVSSGFPDQSQGVYKSSNGGISWDRMIGSVGGPLSRDPQNPDVLYVYEQNQTLWESEDGGKSWNLKNRDYLYLTDDVFLQIDARNSNVLYLYGSDWNSVYGRVFKSLDGGRTWGSVDELKSGGPTCDPVFDPLSPDLIYAGTISGVDRSSNGAANWIPVNEGLPNFAVSNLSFDVNVPHTIYAATRGGGIFSATFSPNPPAALSLARLSSDQQWEVGSTQNIVWSSTADIWEVKLEVSYDNGVTYSTIANNIPNTGYYAWTIPNTLSDQVKIRISDRDGKATAVSTGNLAIVAPSGAGKLTISILSPAPGTVVSGVVTVKVSVSDSSQVGSVLFLTYSSNHEIDIGDSYQKAGDGSYAIQWDTSTFPSGSYMLYVAVDTTEGLYLTSTEQPITVTNSTPRTPLAWMLPSSARAAGVGGAFYTTDLTIANTGILDAAVTLKFLGHDVDGSSGLEKSIVVGAGKSVTQADVLNSVFGLESGYGAVLMKSNYANLILTSQTSTPRGGGTYGQSFSGMPITGSHRAYPSGEIGEIRENAAFRCNLVLANPVNSQRFFTVALLDPEGNVLASKQYIVPPQGMTQVNRVVRDLGITTDVTGARLSITSSDHGFFIAYASLIDNVTNDPRTLMMQANPAASSYVNPSIGTTWILPSSAHAAGTNGAFYTTDLMIENAGIVTTLGTLRFLGHDASGLEAPNYSFELKPGATLNLADVLHSVFRVESGYGAIRLSATESNLVISSQTSTPSHGGTFGQSVPAFDERDLIKENSPHSICAIREDKGFRTNLILSNAMEQPTVVDVRLISGGGVLLGSRQVTLPPWGMTQLSRVVRQLGVSSDLSNARLELSTSTPGGSFAAYASVIDNVTNDPRTLLPRSQWAMAEWE